MLIHALLRRTASKVLRPRNNVSIAKHEAFHLSRPNPVHPLLVALIKPLSRVSALLAGRKMRQWYRNLPQDQKDKFRSKMRENRHFLLGLSGMFCGFIGYLYYTHLETCPVTGRRRFVALQSDQMKKVSNQEFQAVRNGFIIELCM